MTPDHYVLKRDGTVRKRQVHVQPFRIVKAPGGGTVEEALDAEHGGAPKLDDDSCARWPQIGTGLHERTGHCRRTSSGRWPAASCSSLQARPVTA